MTADRVETSAGLLELVTGFWRSAVLRAVVDLRVADHLDGGPTTAADIAEREGADAANVTILLDAACGLGICTKVGERYALGQAGRLLVGESPLKDVVELWLNSFAWEAVGRLTEVTRSGRPVDALELGHSFWTETFAASSLSVALRSGQWIRDHMAFTRPGARVLDIGCGSGGFAFAFAIADPDAVVTVVDHPSVLEVARTNAVRLGIEGQVQGMARDISQDAGFGVASFDVAILSNVLHLFAASDGARLIRAAGESLAPGGTLIIADYLPDEERQSATLPLLFAMYTRLTSPGTTYTYGELAAWVETAGCSAIKRHNRPGSFTYLTATRG